VQPCTVRSILYDYLLFLGGTNTRPNFIYRVTFCLTTLTLRFIIKGLNIETNEKSPYYGINRTVQTRMLKFTYGTEISSEWKQGDPEERRTPSNRIIRFCCLARRGTQIDVVNRFNDTFGPVNPNQTRLPFNLYYTSAYDAEYCDEEGMHSLGKWSGVCVPLFSFLFEKGSDRNGVQCTLLIDSVGIHC